MIRTILIAVSVLVIGGMAQAQDWSGPFVGGFAGTGELSSLHCDQGAEGYFCDEAHTEILPELEGSGTIFGLRGGYNIQRDNMVYGGEIAFLRGAIDSMSESTDDFGCGSEGCFTEFEGATMVSGKIGYALPKALIYATAGFNSVDVFGAIDEVADGTSGSVSGRHFGLGVEYRVNQMISVDARIEQIRADDSYLYDEDANNCGVPGCGVKDIEMNLISIGANFRF